MDLSASGAERIKQFEGLLLHAYPDGGGYSIGYGHHGVKPGDVISKEEAERLFFEDVLRFEQGVDALLRGPMTTQAQFDAMVSLAYNVGLGAFAGSTLLRLHNQGDYAGAAEQFHRWNKSGNRVLPALVDRRSIEAAIYRGDGYALGQGAPPGGVAPRPYQFTPTSEPGLPVQQASAAPLALGLGLVFFCPHCGERSEVALPGLEAKR